jgi:fumarate hydratase class I
MNTTALTEQLGELIRRTSCDLPKDIELSLRSARDQEQDRARSTLDWMLQNVREAREGNLPICQDTGTMLFFVEHGPDVRPDPIAAAVRTAAAAATRDSILRPNAVHPLSGKNSGNNTGLGAPYLHFEEVAKPGHLTVKLMLKGGGSENCGVQYTLPDTSIQAGRDLSGVKRCILNAALRAQGFGCAPGTLGVGVGGDRMTSYLESKVQFFRQLGDNNPDPELAAVEREMLDKVNQLGIGPMGFSGKNTILGVKIGLRHRHPASFFVSVSYMCWAYRRRTMTVEDGQVRYS